VDGEMFGVHHVKGKEVIVMGCSGDKDKNKDKSKNQGGGKKGGKK
jgi:hypothetical protein